MLGYREFKATVVGSSISRVWFDGWFQAIAPDKKMNAEENSF